MPSNRTVVLACISRLVSFPPRPHGCCNDDPPVPIFSSASLSSLACVILCGSRLPAVSIQSIVRSTVTRLEVVLDLSSISTAAWVTILRALPNLAQLRLLNVVAQDNSHISSHCLPPTSRACPTFRSWTSSVQIYRHFSLV